jgi:cytochrome P450
MQARSATFDYTSPEIQGPQFWDAVRELQRHGPLVWVETNGGFWVATSFDMVLRIAQDWQNFTSTDGVALGRPSFEVMPRLVPIELDPPRQRAYRKVVNPSLTANAIAGLEEPIREIANELIDTFISRGSCDIAVDFARNFPGTVFFRLIVHCGDEDFRTVEPSARVLSFEAHDREKFAEAAATLRAWASRVLESRSGQPETEDLVNAVMHLNDSGETFVDHEHSSGLQILAQGGIGTSASAIGAIMVALCQDRDLQDRVRADPSLIPALVEECLRLEAPVPLMFRTAQRDIVVAGQQIKKGDKVCLLFGSAGREPAVFEHPDEVDLERPHYRHLTFGAGVHRCIGSNLARMQVRVAVERLVARLSPFWIPEGGEVRYSSRQARGPSSIPLEFSPPA